MLFRTPANHNKMTDPGSTEGCPLNHFGTDQERVCASLVLILFGLMFNVFEQHRSGWQRKHSAHISLTRSQQLSLSAYPPDSQQI